MWESYSIGFVQKNGYIVRQHWEMPENNTTIRTFVLNLTDETLRLMGEWEFIFIFLMSIHFWTYVRFKILFYLLAKPTVDIGSLVLYVVVGKDLFCLHWGEAHRLYFVRYLYSNLNPSLVKEIEGYFLFIQFMIPRTVLIKKYTKF